MTVHNKYELTIGKIYKQFGSNAKRRLLSIYRCAKGIERVTYEVIAVDDSYFSATQKGGNRKVIGAKADTLRKTFINWSLKGTPRAKSRYRKGFVNPRRVEMKKIAVLLALLVCAGCGSGSGGVSVSAVQAAEVKTSGTLVVSSTDPVSGLLLLLSAAADSFPDFKGVMGAAHYEADSGKWRVAVVSTSPLNGKEFLKVDNATAVEVLQACRYETLIDPATVNITIK